MRFNSSHSKTASSAATHGVARRFLERKMESEASRIFSKMRRSDAPPNTSHGGGAMRRARYRPEPMVNRGCQSLRSMRKGYNLPMPLRIGGNPMRSRGIRIAASIMLCLALMVPGIRAAHANSLSDGWQCAKKAGLTSAVIGKDLYRNGEALAVKSGPIAAFLFKTGPEAQPCNNGPGAFAPGPATLQLAL